MLPVTAPPSAARAGEAQEKEESRRAAVKSAESSLVRILVIAFSSFLGNLSHYNKSHPGLTRARLRKVRFTKQHLQGATESNDCRRLNGSGQVNKQGEDRHMAILSLCVIYFFARSIISLIIEYVNHQQHTCTKGIFKKVQLIFLAGSHTDCEHRVVKPQSV